MSVFLVDVQGCYVAVIDIFSQYTWITAVIFASLVAVEVNKIKYFPLLQWCTIQLTTEPVPSPEKRTVGVRKGTRP